MGHTTRESFNNLPSQRRVEQAYEQLHRMISHYYRLNLRLRLFGATLTTNEQIMKSLLQKNHPLQMPTSLLFPMYVGTNLVAALEVFGTNAIKPEALERLKQTVDLVLSAKLSSRDELDGLIKMQNQLATQIEERPSNVVYISDYRRSDSGQIAKRDVQASPRVSFNIPCFIRSQSRADIHKMALEIHQLSNRYAFLNIEDLDLARIRSETLSDIGPINIFIPELGKLSTSVQALFLNYLLYHRTKLSPQILTGSALSDERLIKEMQVSKELISLLTTVRLEMKRPFGEYKETGIVNFFYDSLVKIP